MIRIGVSHNIASACYPVNDPLEEITIESGASFFVSQLSGLAPPLEHLNQS